MCRKQRRENGETNPNVSVIHLLHVGSCRYGMGRRSNAASVSLHRFGTAILSIVMPGELIAVAADSKAVGVTEEGDEKSLSECKIRKISENVFFATTGLWRSKTYNAANIIAEALRENEEPQEGVVIAENRIQKYLADELSRLRLNSPRNFIKWFKELRYASVIVFGLQKGSLFLYSSDFVASDTDPIHVQVTRHECPGKECPPGQTHMTFYGHSIGLDEYHRTHNKVPVIDLNWIKNAMESAIKAEPQFVGPPIDIIRINEKGARWVQVKKECE